VHPPKKGASKVRVDIDAALLGAFKSKTLLIVLFFHGEPKAALLGLLSDAGSEPLNRRHGHRHGRRNHHAPRPEETPAIAHARRGHRLPIVSPHRGAIRRHGYDRRWHDLRHGLGTHDAE
jgi:hypothetical protein